MNQIILSCIAFKRCEYVRELAKKWDNCNDENVHLLNLNNSLLNDKSIFFSKIDQGEKGKTHEKKTTKSLKNCPNFEICPKFSKH